MMKRGIAFAAACAVMATLMPVAAQAAEKCASIAGAEQLVKRPRLRWLIVGETHGTKELPEAFGDLVCIAAAAHGKPVTIGLEFPLAEQNRFDAYMTSKGDAAARKALMLGEAWQNQDGRASEAMITLIERLRVMKSQGQVARVLAILGRRPVEDGQPYDQGRSEVTMAEAMRSAGTEDGLTLILVGDIHAIIRKPERMSYTPAAALLPADQTRTIGFTVAGGAAWTCQMIQTSRTLQCGPHALPAASQPRARGVTELPADAPWSDLFSLGAAISASPPAVPAEHKPKPAS